MKITSRILMTLVSLGVAHTAMAEEEPALAEQQEPGRWHFSAGARLAPGVKTKASISSRAVTRAVNAARAYWAMKLSPKPRESAGLLDALTGASQ